MTIYDPNTGLPLPDTTRGSLDNTTTTPPFSTFSVQGPTGRTGPPGSANGPPGPPTQPGDNNRNTPGLPPPPASTTPIDYNQFRGLSYQDLQARGIIGGFGQLPQGWDWNAFKAAGGDTSAMPHEIQGASSFNPSGAPISTTPSRTDGSTWAASNNPIPNNHNTNNQFDYGAFFRQLFQFMNGQRNTNTNTNNPLGRNTTTNTGLNVSNMVNTTTPGFNPLLGKGQTGVTSTITNPNGFKSATTGQTGGVFGTAGQFGGQHWDGSNWVDNNTWNPQHVYDPNQANFQQPPKDQTWWDSSRGILMRNGQQYVQIGNIGAGNEDNTQFKPTNGDPERYFHDTSQLIYDPEYGWITPQSNLRDTSSFMDRYGVLIPLLAAAGVAGFQGLAELGAGSGPFAGAVANGSLTGGADAFAGAGASAEGFWNPGANPWEGSIASATGTSATGIPSWLQTLYNNPVTRILAGPLISHFLNGGNTRMNLPNGPPNNNNNNNNNNNDGGFNWMDLISGGLNGYFNNQEIQNIFNRQSQLLQQGDWMSQYRPQFMSNLLDTYTNPASALAPFAASDARDLGNVSRQLAARGFNMSGNEEGDLIQRQSELDQQHLSDYRAGLVKALGMGDQSIYSNALRNLPFMAQMLANRDASNSSNLSSVLRNLLGNNTNTSNLPSWLQQILGNNTNTNNNNNNDGGNNGLTAVENWPGVYTDGKGNYFDQDGNPLDNFDPNISQFNWGEFFGD